ncbi:fibroblast growth factor receptor substrate 2b isoform X2 [Denticeps clupeoides]|uniref:Uncharacterized protein n=1 Tax=Denticeps clupeoides TaxID=299321 RepID=A0AAY4BUQ3_9TELE|nr:fibroblast growth factor receptor substrate 2-like isoform X2 [Denticeps clupeoides]
MLSGGRTCACGAMVTTPTCSRSRAAGGARRGRDELKRAGAGLVSPGIFAFKCTRAEEIFNLLQEIMHRNSINVVEEPVFESSRTQPEPDQVHTLPTPTTPGNSLATLPNGSLRYPSLSDPSSHPSSRHTSVGSARLPSAEEESSRPVQVADETVRAHTYINTTDLLEDQPSLTAADPLLEGPCIPALNGDNDPPPEVPEPGPRVQLELESVRFVLGPTPVQRQQQLLAKQKQQEGSCRSEVVSLRSSSNGDLAGAVAPSNNTSQELEAPIHQRRRRNQPLPLTPDPTNSNNSAQRRTVLLDYENLPALPPLREASGRAGSEDEEEEDDDEELKTPSVNGFHAYQPRHYSPDPTHYYINTENVTVPLSAHRPDSARWRDHAAPTVFNFDFRRPDQINYIEVETEGRGAGGSDSSNPQTPKTPTMSLPQTPTRRTEVYAVIDVERTAAMSSLQKALPRYDGTSRKTRHNSVDLPM